MKQNNMIRFFKYIVFLHAIIISSITFTFAASNNCKVSPMIPAGCSFLFGGSLEIIPGSSPACDQHDLCYSYIGKDKNTCDDKLIADMRKLCHEKFGKSLIGHADLNWINCDAAVDIHKNILNDNVLTKEAWRDEQNRSINIAITNADNDCDIPDNTGVATMSTKESKLYGGSDAVMVQAIAGQFLLNNVLVRPISDETTQNIISHYRDWGNAKTLRVSCSKEAVAECVNTNYETIDICSDQNWQNELIRDLRDVRNFDVWNGIYSGAPRTSSPFWLSRMNSGKALVADYDGDGKSDWMRFDNSPLGWTVCLSDGTKFGQCSTWIGAGNGNARTGDFNGDGKSDWMRYDNSPAGWTVCLSDGTKFGQCSTWLAAANGNVVLGDFNGDKSTDWMRYDTNPAGWTVCLSNGLNKFEQCSTWSTAADGNAIVGDYNGDGLSDWMRWDNCPRGWTVCLSDATKFDKATCKNWLPGVANSQAYTGDFNGDGFLDDFLKYTNKPNGWLVYPSDGTRFIY